MIRQKYCRKCKSQTPHQASVNHVVHFILSVFTGGIWLIVWLLCALFPKWVCGQRH